MSDASKDADPGNPYDSPQADTSQVDAKPGDGPDKDERQMAMFAHMSAIAASLVTGFALGFIGPLVIWIIKKDESEFVADQAKEALNFQLTLLIVVVLCWVGAIASCGILFFLPGLPFVLQLIFGIIGGMKANEGEWYRYPFNIRMVT